MDHQDVQNLIDNLEKRAEDADEHGDTTGTAILSSTAAIMPALYDIILELRNIEMSLRQKF
jgi:hypothetical protein